MPFFPQNQTITVTRYRNELDPYGELVVDRVFTIKCMVEEGSYLTHDAASAVNGKVQVSRLKIFIDKLADIQYSDDIEYTDELGRTYKNKPIEINVRRMFGKPILTEVYL